VSLAAYLEQKSPWKEAACSPNGSQIGYYWKREGTEEGHDEHMQRENILLFETDRRSMWCERRLEGLVGGEAELAVLGGDAWTHVHTESVVGTLGRGATDRADGVWEGRGVDIVKIIRCEGPDVQSGGKEGFIRRGVRGGMSGRTSGRNLGHSGHCKGEEMTLWRGALCLIYSKVQCQGGRR
jgi:hypothetical protein